MGGWAHDFNFAACSAGRADRSHPRLVHEAGRSLPARVPQTARGHLDARLLPGPRTRHRDHPPARAPSRSRRRDLLLRHRRPLQAAGVEVEIVGGRGPVLAAPIRTRADVEALPELEPDQIPDIAESVGRITAELGSDTPLIGFAGAPFTLASYLIEGGPSKNHEKTKSLMVADPETFSLLLSKLARISATFIDVRLSAGASAFQLFDSWAGYLNRRDYDDHVLEHSTAVFDALAGHDVPSIHFGVQTGEPLGSMSRAGSTAMGVDFRVALTDAATRIQPGQALQGNLDPAALFAPWEALAPRIGEIVRAGLSHDAGFVFNLGHGVLPDTDPEVPGRVVAEVHRVSAEILGEAAATR